MKMIVEKADLQRLIDANESVKGTRDYRKYYMPYYFKYKNGKDGEWSKWYYMGYYVPRAEYDMEVKKVGETIYLMGKEYMDCGSPTIKRFELTEESNKILKVY